MSARTSRVGAGAMFVHALSAGAAERVALVIGNGAYRHAPDLVNPRNDAADIAAALGRLGFAVTTISDADKQTLERGLQGSRGSGVQSKGVGGEDRRSVLCRTRHRGRRAHQRGKARDLLPEVDRRDAQPHLNAMWAGQGKITKNFSESMSYCESDVDFSDKAISIHRHAWG